MKRIWKELVSIVKMGADQSTSNTQLRSQRDEDIPYTSYSISKPIDADTPRPSPLRTAQRRSPQPPQREAQRDSNANPSHDIIMVGEGTTQEGPDRELQRLSTIPVFLPLLKGSLNIPSSSHQGVEAESLEKVNSKHVLQMCHRYQEHLRQCGEAVAFDQNALCVRIKEVDITVSTLYNNLTERQKRFAKYAEQIKKVNETSTVLSRVKMNVDQLIPLLDRLNNVLPPGDQLEPFSMKSE